MPIHHFVKIPHSWVSGTSSKASPRFFQVLHSRPLCSLAQTFKTKEALAFIHTKFAAFAFCQVKDLSNLSSLRFSACPRSQQRHCQCKLLWTCTILSFLFSFGVNLPPERLIGRYGECLNAEDKWCDQISRKLVLIVFDASFPESSLALSLSLCRLFVFVTCLSQNHPSLPRLLGLPQGGHWSRTPARWTYQLTFWDRCTECKMDW